MDVARRGRESHLERFRAFIEARLSDMDFELAEVATAFGFSDRYVRQVFELSEETPSEFIRRRRTELAAHMLRDRRNDSQTILSIAFDCGFTSAAYFSRCFVQYFGVPPRVYRKQGNRVLSQYFGLDWLAMVATFTAIHLLGSKRRAGFLAMNLRGYRKWRGSEAS